MANSLSDKDELVQTADGSLTLHSARYGQTYHSIHGARTESEHVFLDGGRVIDGLKQRADSKGDEAPFRVLELGLGLGLNALLSAEAAERIGASLMYVGIENDFADERIIERALGQFSEASVTRFLASIKKAQRVESKQARTYINDLTELSVWHEDIPTAITHMTQAPETDRQYFNAIYLDAFSPDSNPECWTSEIICCLGQLLSSGGTLSTYCAKGAVRRAMVGAGLHVTRRPGPPGKRECLVGVSPS